MTYRNDEKSHRQNQQLYNFVRHKNNTSRKCHSIRPNKIYEVSTKKFCMAYRLSLNEAWNQNVQSNNFVDVLVNIQHAHACMYIDIHIHIYTYLCGSCCYTSLISLVYMHTLLHTLALCRMLVCRAAATRPGKQTSPSYPVLPERLLIGIGLDLLAIAIEYVQCQM